MVLIALLYAGPLRSYYGKQQLVASQHSQVDALRSRQQELEQRIRRASTRQAVEREARRLSYVNPSEHQHLYIVKGIEQWRESRKRSRK